MPSGDILRVNNSMGIDYRYLLSPNSNNAPPPMPTQAMPAQPQMGLPQQQNGPMLVDQGGQNNALMDPTGSMIGDNTSNVPVILDPKKIEEEKLEMKKIRKKLFGYFHKLPELVCNTFVEWPNPISQLTTYSIDQLRELYDLVLESIEVTSVMGGAITHNTAIQMVETVGIQYGGFRLNGLAEELRLETVAKNLQDRLRQLVTMLEIEYGMGFKNPFIEYMMLVSGVAMKRHYMLSKSAEDLVFEKQQYDAIPLDIERQFQHL